MADKYQLLKRYWGYSSFRPLQESIIDAAAGGADVLALLPTGGGKSLCYQIPGLLREGLCLVVSPLIALMKDQVQQLRDRHIKAACIVTGMTHNEVTGVLNNAVVGELKFLYVSPERLQMRQFVEHFRRMKVGLIAVDEAHCVSQWGYDFRPPYLQIASIRAYHPAVPLIAVTATATREVADDICRQLHMNDCRRFVGSFVRANLVFSVLHDADKRGRLLHLVRTLPGSGILYVRNRRLTQTYAQMLVDAGISATYYHAGLAPAERDRRQAEWMSGRSRIMVATNAFGMGIDKGDVRFVVHLDLPDSLEAYYQEAGRAGRDGQQAHAVLLCDPSDFERLARDFDADHPSLRFVRNVYRALCNYYRMPVGGGGDERHDFDMARICSVYNFAPRMFYSACRYLEREGLVSIPEREATVSTLYIPLRRDELYRYQVNHQAQGDLLMALLRMYPGLMNGAVNIDERKIAAKVFGDAGYVSGMLAALDAAHVVEYRPVPTEPQIIFTQGRVDESLIGRSDRDYATLVDAALRRRKAMENYALDDSLCRCRQMVRYFGVDDVADCGVCDVCRKGGDATDVKGKVRELLRSHTMTVADVAERFSDSEVQEVLRTMLDCGELYLDKDNFLRLS